MSIDHLPISNVIPQLQHTLRGHTLVVLTAEPGAGKTTHVPLALLKEPWLEPKKIIMLEPRRLAARAAATYMAKLLHEPVGETVGYRTRLDTKIRSTTKIEVVTEGILTRILQHDPSLHEYGLVIFDEFHERNLQADLGLALCRQTQALFREDLRLLIMSATLDTRTLSQQLKHAPILTCKGRTFPVETRYVGLLDNKNFPHQIAKTIQQLLNTETGNLLVFLPGTGEIREVEEHLGRLPLPSNTHITPLDGSLSPQAQDHAILSPPAGNRKVVLSTNIAETSLTVEGIRIVLDSGLMRIPQFDVQSGMSRLVTKNISQHSADQRRGRAGRLEPGLCVRCWTEAAQRTLAPRTPPEILDSDLTSMALELAAWGTKDTNELSWIDPPPKGAWQQARQLLLRLDAIDREGRITAHGKKMVSLPMHPRLAHLVLQAINKQVGTLGCDLAALLSESHLLKRHVGQDQADLLNIMEEYYRHIHQGTVPAVAQRISQISQKWQKMLGIQADTRKAQDTVNHIGVLLALAYPDRIAKRQSNANRGYKLTNGRLAQFRYPNPLEQEKYLAISDLDGRQPVSHIYMATPIKEEDLLKTFADLVHTKEQVQWDDMTKTVIANREQHLGELLLGESRLHSPNPELMVAALVQGLQINGLSFLPWTKTQRQWQARVQFLHRVMGAEHNWPKVSDNALLESVEVWLAPYLREISSFSQLKKVDITWPLHALLSHEQQRTLDTLAPTHLPVPSGSCITLNYESGEIPILAVRLQELFGLTETPLIADGKVPILIHLLSPARRPIQVTQDLKSFWETGYHQVKKELKGRYPKHFWPDDPLHAPPTRGIKKLPAGKRTRHSKQLPIRF